MATINHAVVVTRGTGTDQIEIANYELASIVGECLHTAYPGYLWRVNAEIEGGVVNIICGDVSYESGCTIMIADLAEPTAAKRHVLKAGGEILERAKLHRGRMREHELADAKRDIRGNIIGLN